MKTSTAHLRVKEEVLKLPLELLQPTTACESTRFPTNLDRMATLNHIIPTLEALTCTGMQASKHRKHSS